MTGTIKLYKENGNCNRPVRLETERYYSDTERKRIMQHWKRKYNGSLDLCFIQIAPGVDLTGKYVKK